MWTLIIVLGCCYLFLGVAFAASVWTDERPHRGRSRRVIACQFLAVVAAWLPCVVGGLAAPREPEEVIDINDIERSQ